ncbi:MAG: DUF3488 domain-containing protein [Verrucomicrobia bacterium]|nr:DUF3488 domain-containing protein [Verrucomicrobiota bacterium]
MTLPQLFKFLSFLMVLLGTLSLLIFGHHASSPGTGLLVIAALFGGLFVWESKLHTPAWELVWKIVAVLYVGHVVVDILGGSIEMVQTRVVKHAANLSIFLHLYKIYNRKTARDYMQMYLISFFQFVSCTTLTTSFGFFFFFALYVVVALWTLSLYHIRNQVERHRAYPARGGVPVALRLSGSELFGKAVGSLSTVGVRRILSPTYFATTFALAMLILLVSLGMFFLFPRQEVAGQSGLLGQFQFQGSTTGLSGEVNLDRHGRISEDPRVVMEVSLPYVREIPAKVLWRAGALAYYDGAMWQESPSGRADPERPDTRGVPATVSLSYLTDYGRLHFPGLDVESLRSRGDLWEARVSLQPGDTTYVVSVLGPPVWIESSTPLRAGQMDTFRFRLPSPTAVAYTVFAEFAPPSERVLEQAVNVSDLQDPRGRIRRFYRSGTPLTSKAAALLRDTVNIDQYPTPYEKIKAIQDYLEENYVYTLDIDQAPEGVDPLEHFLLTSRQGHCEFFASAMALMLRECGIISRVVYGYMTTEASFNKYLGGSFVVRRRDAHAWVEAGLDLDGDELVDWVVFDPSPRQAEISEPGSALGRFFAGVDKFFEALKMRWHESIVAFDRRYQNRIAERIETTLHDMEKAAADRVRNAALWVRWLWGRLTRTQVTAVLTPLALACFVSAGALLIARRVRRQVEFRRAYVENQPERQIQTVRFYERMLRMLLHYDIVKPSQQTPHEFAGTLEPRLELAPAVAGLTELYYAVRFGHAQLTGKQIRWVHEALATLRTTLGRSAESAKATGDSRPKPLDTPRGQE